MDIPLLKNTSSDLRALIALSVGFCFLIASAPAHAHGDFGALVVVFGIGALVVVGSLVTAMVILINRAARKRRIAQGAQAGSDQASESLPFWYWIVLFLLCANLLFGGTSLVAVASSWSRGVSFGGHLGGALMLVLQVGLCLAAIIGISTFRRWGWWAGVALFAWAAMALLIALIAGLASTGGSMFLWNGRLVGLSALAAFGLGLLLLPSARRLFFDTPRITKPRVKPPMQAKRFDSGQAQAVARTDQSLNVDSDWLDTIPGFKPEPDAQPRARIDKPAQKQPKELGLPVAERWIGGGVIVLCVFYLVWLFAWPWLRVNLLSEYEERAAAQRRDKAADRYSPRDASVKLAEPVIAKPATQASRAGAEPASQANQSAAQSAPQPSRPEDLFQPGPLLPLSQADYARLERNPPPEIPEPGQPHCRIGLYANSLADSQPLLSIWRSRNGLYFLILLNDGDDGWYGQAVTSDYKQKTARLGGQEPSLPFTVKFKLLEPGRTVENSTPREIDIQVTSKPVFSEATKQASFDVKTSMKRYATMKAREDCASGTLAYLSMSPELYRFGQ